MCCESRLSVTYSGASSSFDQGSGRRPCLQLQCRPQSKCSYTYVVSKVTRSEEFPIVNQRDNMQRVSGVSVGPANNRTDVKIDQRSTSTSNTVHVGHNNMREKCHEDLWLFVVNNGYEEAEEQTPHVYWGEDQEQGGRERRENAALKKCSKLFIPISPCSRLHTQPPVSSRQITKILAYACASHDQNASQTYECEG